MRVYATRLLAFVVLLLAVASLTAKLWEPVIAASQLEQTVQVYFPYVPVPNQESYTDLKIVHLGLFQSVQNQSNGVTLIAHKPAMLRVHALSVDGERNSTLATVTIKASRNGQSLGSITIGPQVVSLLPTAEDLDSTFNFELPSDWLEGTIVLEATIDQTGVVSELDETNNTHVGTFVFHSVPSLDLTIVPITYVDTVTGISFSESPQDPISDWLLSAFPISEVSVKNHAPYIFTGNLRLGEEWVRLLTELTALWSTEVGPGSSQIYYGLVPNSTESGGSWFEGGVSGLGWIGQRVSVGLNVGVEAAKNAGHEIGHNLGRKHAPCGNPTGVDPHFPYPNASIGVYGVDTAEEELLDPASTHDVMSYCGPEWVSDYTYEGLFQDQYTRGSRTGHKAEGWLLRASLKGKTLTALPALRLNQPFLPVETPGEYQVRLLDGNGKILGTFEAELYEAEEYGASARMLVAHVPAEGLGVVTAQFLSGDSVLAVQSIDPMSD